MTRRTPLSAAVLALISGSLLVTTGFAPQGTTSTPPQMVVTFTTVKKPLGDLVPSAAKAVKDASGKWHLPDFALINPKQAEKLDGKTEGFVISDPRVYTLAGMAANISMQCPEPSTSDCYSFSVTPSVDKDGKTYRGAFELRYRPAMMSETTTKLTVRFPKDSALGFKVSPDTTVIVKMSVVSAY